MYSLSCASVIENFFTLQISLVIARFDTTCVEMFSAMGEMYVPFSQCFHCRWQPLWAVMLLYPGRWFYCWYLNVHWIVLEFCRSRNITKCHQLGWIFWLSIGQWRSAFEHGNEFSGPINGGEFLKLVSQEEPTYLPSFHLALQPWVSLGLLYKQSPLFSIPHLLFPSFHLHLPQVTLNIV
jgi:hypothetical protein